MKALQAVVTLAFTFFVCARANLQAQLAAQCAMTIILPWGILIVTVQRSLARSRNPAIGCRTLPQFGGRYYADKPSGGPDYVRFMTLVLPKK